MTQLLAHLFGDYILQSDWMAQNKTKANLPAFCHALIYSAAFWLLAVHAHHPWMCWLTIFITHFLIDRYRLARYVVWAKNWLGPRKAWFRIPYGSGIRLTDVDEGTMRRYCTAPVPPFHACPNGYPPAAPIWLSTWLLIIADNTLHLLINFLALRYL
jgi:hypothetical protein